VEICEFKRALNRNAAKFPKIGLDSMSVSLYWRAIKKKQIVGCQEEGADDALKSVSGGNYQVTVLKITKHVFTLCTSIFPARCAALSNESPKDEADRPLGGYSDD
jgi:hypothetical protein